MAALLLQGFAYVRAGAYPYSTARRMQKCGYELMSIRICRIPGNFKASETLKCTYEQTLQVGKHIKHVATQWN